MSWKGDDAPCENGQLTNVNRVQRGGRVEIIANDQGHRITPSWVAFSDEERLSLGFRQFATSGFSNSQHAHSSDHPSIRPAQQQSHPEFQPLQLPFGRHPHPPVIVPPQFLNPQTILQHVPRNDSSTSNPTATRSPPPPFPGRSLPIFLPRSFSLSR